MFQKETLTWCKQFKNRLGFLFSMTHRQWKRSKTITASKKHQRKGNWRCKMLQSEAEMTQFVPKHLRNTAERLQCKVMALAHHHSWKVSSRCFQMLVWMPRGGSCTRVWSQPCFWLSKRSRIKWETMLRASLRGNDAVVPRREPPAETEWVNRALRVWLAWFQLNRRSVFFVLSARFGENSPSGTTDWLLVFVFRLSNPMETGK